MEEPLTIRNMNLEEFKKVIGWINDEKWLFSESDAEAFYSLDPNGFFLGEVKGQPAACALVINFNNEYTFLGVLIVREEHRRKNYAVKLIEHSLNYCKDSKVVGVDISDGISKYWTGRGFRESCQNYCFTKKANGARHPDLLDLKQDLPFDLVASYDLEVFGYDRRRFLELLIGQQDYYALGAMKDGKLIGFGVLRKLHTEEGYIVGPLSADCPEVAKQILDGLQSYVPGKNVFISRFDTNQDANDLISEKNGWERVAVERRLYRGGQPKTDNARTYVPTEELS